MLIIGESINGTNRKIAQVILNRDETCIGKLARMQHGYEPQIVRCQCMCGGANEIEDLPG